MRYASAIFRLALFAACCAFAIFLADAAVPIDGRAEIGHSFGAPHGVVGLLRPLARLRSGEEDGNMYQDIIEDPVYFEIAAPVAYDSLALRVRYKRGTQRPLSLGIKRGDGWDFQIVPVQETRGADGWTVGEAALDLAAIPRFNGKYILLFSLPGMQVASGEYLRLKDADIVLSREPLSLSRAADLARAASRALMQSLPL